MSIPKPPEHYDETVNLKLQATGIGPPRETEGGRTKSASITRENRRSNTPILGNRPSNHKANSIADTSRKVLDAMVGALTPTKKKVKGPTDTETTPTRPVRPGAEFPTTKEPLSTETDIHEEGTGYPRLWSDARSLDSRPDVFADSNPDMEGTEDNNSVTTMAIANSLSNHQKLENLRENLKEAGSCLRALQISKAVDMAKTDEPTAQYLHEIMDILLTEPFTTTANQHTTLLEALTVLAKKVDSMAQDQEIECSMVTEKLDGINQVTIANNAKLNAIEARVHTTNSARADPRTFAPPTMAQTYANAMHNAPTKPVAQHKTGPKANPPISNNPNTAHHPTRLVIQFLPDGIAEEGRMEPTEVVEIVNAALALGLKSKHLKVVAATYNHQRNLILSTRSDQTAAELISFADVFTSKIAQGHEVVAREDKKWYKIQIDGVSTVATQIDGTRRVHNSDAIQAELATCNPVFDAAQSQIVSHPRWMRTLEETRNTMRSSVVFAVDNEGTAKRILAGKTLAAFGRHCTLRAYQDRPPIKQCKNCWGWDHTADKCKVDPKCRLCSGAHTEVNHPVDQECQVCQIMQDNGDMATGADGNSCDHIQKCANCVKAGVAERNWNHTADSRRCPERLDKYGTARNYERKAEQSQNPWKVIVPRPKPTLLKGKTKGKARQPQDPLAQIPPMPAQFQDAFRNSFAPIDTPFNLADSDWAPQSQPPTPKTLPDGGSNHSVC